MEYAIVDIETTGGSATDCGITEIAIVIHNGEQIIDEFETLINPNQPIPSYITGLTGIDQAMVQNAPTFQEIADKIWELLHGRVFVAHSVNFDFSFIKESFKQYGKQFVEPKLCTVRLSRKVFPGLSSYSLGRICETRKIPILARHRAMGDARATALLFDEMIKKSPEIISYSLKKNSGEAFLPPNFSLSKFRQIPEKCGVYYMINDRGKVIYVGKAINIKERFKNHFSGNLLPGLKQNLKAEIVDLKWELTGSEMMALLFEALEIKRLWPKYNSALKQPKALWGLFHYEDNSGYSRFQIAKVTKHLKPLESFFSSDDAIAFLKDGISSFDLCPRLCGLRKAGCKEGEYQSCQGKCQSELPPSEYNINAQKLVARIEESKKEILLKMEGRDENEITACVFEKGVLRSFGYFEKGMTNETILENITSVPVVPETFYILKQFLPLISADQIQVLNTVS